MYNINKLVFNDPKKEIIVLTFDSDKIAVSEAYDIFTNIRNSIPKEYNVIATIKGLECEIKFIDKLIEELLTIKEKNNVENIY